VENTKTEVSKYMKEVCKHPILTKDEELVLARQAKLGDQVARDKLIVSNLRFVVQIANKYKAYTKSGKYSILDLIQEGNSGLVYAYDKYDPESGYRFTTYAVHWIKARIMNYIIRMHSLIKVGTTVSERKFFIKMGKIKSLLDEKDLDTKELMQHTLAEELKVTIKTIKEIEERFYWHDVSVDKTMNNTDSANDDKMYTLKDVLLAPSAEDLINDTNLLDNMRDVIDRAMEHLSDREKDIIEARWLTDDGATLQKIADKYDLSRERIRQIESQVFEKMKKFIEIDEVGEDVLQELQHGR
jgi:RNA polymerase sigma-32 factor